MRKVTKKTTATLLGVAAAALTLAGCTKTTRTVETIPFCPSPPRSVDLCTEAMGVHSLPHLSFVKGIINVKTVHRPRVFTMYAFLYVRTPSGWKDQDQKVYHIGTLPPVGHSGVLQPVLEAVCENRAWVIDIHVIGIDSVGKAVNEWVVWPGANGRLNTFVFSESQIPQKYWPTRPALKCL